MPIFRFTLRLLRRHGRSLFLSGASIAVGSLLLSVVLGGTGSVRALFLTESQSLSGGDIVLWQNDSIERPLEIPELAGIGAQTSTRVQTLSYLQGKETGIAVSLQAVDDAYPLYGQLEWLPGGYSRPHVGEIIVAPEILVDTGWKMGETVSVGKAELTIVGTIVKEPDRLTANFALAPRVMMHISDWESAGLKEASRASIGIAYRFPPTLSDNDARKLEEIVSQEGREAGLEVWIARDGPGGLVERLKILERFLLLVSLLALFLIAVNVRANLSYLVRLFTRTIALFRSVGMTKRSVFFLFLLFFLLAATMGSVVGIVLGFGILSLGLPQVGAILGETLMLAHIPETALIVMGIVLALALAAGVEFLIRIVGVRPGLLLSSGHDEEAEGGPLALLSTGILLSTIFLLTLLLVDRWSVALYVTLGIGVTFAVLVGTVSFLLAYGAKKRRTLRFSLWSTLAFLSFAKERVSVASSTLAIALIGTLTLAIVAGNLERSLRGEIAENVPSLYLIDIQKDQVKPLETVLGPIIGTTSLVTYPTLRARLMTINERDIQRESQAPGGNREFIREFNLTYRDSLIPGEKVVAGEYHTGKTGEVSLEKPFAERAGIAVGDTVELLVQGFSVQARVTSLREVDTRSGRPFFFFVFSPDLLERFPSTSFGYVEVGENEIARVSRAVTTQFPNITPLPTKEFLSLASEVIGALLSAIIAVAVPTVLLGILMILAVVALLESERERDLARMRAFGATKKTIQGVILREASSYVGISILVAIFGTIPLSYYLVRILFELPGFFIPWWTIVLLLSLLMGVILWSFISTRGIARRPTTTTILRSI